MLTYPRDCHLSFLNMIITVIITARKLTRIYATCGHLVSFCATKDTSVASVKIRNTGYYHEVTMNNATHHSLQYFDANFLSRSHLPQQLPSPDALPVWTSNMLSC